MANELKFKSNVSITGNLNSASFSIDKFSENNLPSGDLVDGSIIYNSDRNSILIWDIVAAEWQNVLPSQGSGTIQGVSATQDIRATNEGGTIAGIARGENSVDLQTYRVLTTQVAAAPRSGLFAGKENAILQNFPSLGNANQSVIIGGNQNNVDSANNCVIAGGLENYTGTGTNLFVGGGTKNFVRDCNYGAIIGGNNNLVTGINSVILGGSQNEAEGNNAVILGGSENIANAGYSLASGNSADCNGFIGARVFADQTNEPLVAAHNQEFAVQTQEFTIMGGANPTTAKLGIGTQFPTETIEARGNILSTIADGTESTLIREGVIELRRDTGISYIDFKHGDYDYDARISSSIDGGFNLDVGGDGNIINNAFVIRPDGNVGIGKSLPTSKLQILDGNIALETTGGNKGFITQEGTGLTAGVDTGIGLCASDASLPSQGQGGIGADLFVNDLGYTIARGKVLALDDVEIRGQIQITGGNPGLNKVLTCDAAGVATWEASGGIGSSLTDLQTIYVSKDGNNLNSGTNIGEPKLTISAAILSLAGESNAHTIQVLDDGIYEEEITLTSSLSLHALFATIVGQIELGAFSRVKVDKHYWGASTSTDLVVLGPNASVGVGITASYEANLMDTRGITGGEGTTNATAIKLSQVGQPTQFHVKVDTIRLGDHRGITITGTGAGLHTLYFNIDTIELYATNAKGIFTGSGDTFGAQYIGTIGNIITKSGTNHAGIHMVTTANATVNVKCNELSISGTSAASYRILDDFAGDPDEGELYISCNNIVTDNREGTPAYENSNLSSGGTPGTALSGTVAGGSGSTEIFVNGDGSTRMIVPIDTTWMFTTLIAGRSATESAGYKIEGVIKNDGGTTSLVGTAIKTVFGEDDPAWDATVNANNTALTFLVTGDSTDSVNWSATVNKTEVN